MGFSFRHHSGRLAFFRLFPWCISTVDGLGLRCGFAYRGCFVSLLLVCSSSVHETLFLGWPFFFSVTPYSVFVCLRCLSHSVYGSFRSKVSLSGGVARWDESVILLFAPSSSPPGVSSGLCQLLPGFPLCLCLRGFLFWTLPFLSSSECCLQVLSSPSSSSMASYRSLLGSVFRCILFVFSSRSAVLVYVAFVLPVLCHSPGFLRGVFCWFLPSFGGSPFGVSLSIPAPCGSPAHGSFGLGSSGLGWDPLHYALLITCASTLECLFRIWALPSLSSFWFISLRSLTILIFRLLYGSFPRIGFSGVFLCSFFPPPSLSPAGSSPLPLASAVFLGLLLPLG